MANVQKFPVYYVGETPEEAKQGFTFEDYDAAIDYVLDTNDDSLNVYSALATVDFNTLVEVNEDGN